MWYASQTLIAVPATAEILSRHGNELVWGARLRGDRVLAHEAVRRGSASVLPSLDAEAPGESARAAADRPYMRCGRRRRRRPCHDGRGRATRRRRTAGSVEGRRQEKMIFLNNNSRVY
jgi:hypothetical protein